MIFPLDRCASPPGLRTAHAEGSAGSAPVAYSSSVNTPSSTSSLGRYQSAPAPAGSRVTGKDVDAALDLFQDESYWRDFVAFTWNLKTLEGKADIRRMLQATLDHVQPANWALAEDATGSTGPDGTVEAWITFETAAARGYGHLRLRNGKC
jgi:hypothetical protein